MPPTHSDEGIRLATPRERQVPAAIAQGKSNSLIAAELFLTKRSVEKNVNAIFLKLGPGHAEDVSRRVKAALISSPKPTRARLRES